MIIYRTVRCTPFKNLLPNRPLKIEVDPYYIPNIIAVCKYYKLGNFVYTVHGRRVKGKMCRYN